MQGREMGKMPSFVMSMSIMAVSGRSLSMVMSRSRPMVPGYLTGSGVNPALLNLTTDPDEKKKKRFLAESFEQ